VRAGRVICATGAIERTLVFGNNDRPGVMLASAVQTYVNRYAVRLGKRAVIFTNNNSAYTVAADMAAAGIEIAGIVDSRAEVPDAARAAAPGLDILSGQVITTTFGRRCVKAVTVTPTKGGAERKIACDLVAISGGWNPAVHLWSQSRGTLAYDEALSSFRPDEAAQCAASAGAADGLLTLADALHSGAEAGANGSTTPDVPTSEDLPYAIDPLWRVKHVSGIAFLDMQNDVSVDDVHLALREGYDNVEHVKRYTTGGMGIDQGKVGNINIIGTVAMQKGLPIEEVGTTTFRPPYTPISLGSIAGEARGSLFKPTRRTAMDEWSDTNGAHWEPVGDWRRPFTYIQKGETIASAVSREILNTRKKVGLLDASTLGKIMVKGPDAAKFLDLMYTNVISTLKVGKCRYGLMCNENGFLFDDGVVVRLNNDTFLCHTTSGGSDRVYSWMEEWLQTEWWKLNVFVTNITEQFSQIAIVGPHARDVLEDVLEQSFLSDDLPFMGMSTVEYQNAAINIYRISFSGELSYEIAVPTKTSLMFWKQCIEKGAKYGIQPYGTEALHVMRAEKGFIMIGDETDGTVIPQDLNLNWAVSKVKTDFIGKRAHNRSFMMDPKRKKLVGILTEDPEIVLPDGAHAVEGTKSNGRSKIIGHVTSTYFSPTLGRSIAMALIEGGLDRVEEIIDFSISDEKVIRARVVDPVFYDKEGEKQNV
jgi:sarcosine oxidase subunit alpha